MKAERERRSAFDSRGQALVTTSGVLVTLLAGLAAAVRAGTALRPPPLAVATVVLALALFVISANCGIAAGWNRHYALATYATLTRMLDDHWKDTEVDARNNVATVHAITVKTLRAANRFKAACVSIGLIVQVLALIVFASATLMILANSG